MAAINFNVNDLPDGKDFSPVPAGEYDVTIDKVTVGPTKAGTGNKMDITFKLDSGRLLFTTLNIQNPNPTAEAIGLAELKAILTAVNIQTLTDTDQLIGKRLRGTVTIKPAADGYEAKNEVKGYKKCETAAIPAPTAAPFGAGKINW